MEEPQTERRTMMSEWEYCLNDVTDFYEVTDANGKFVVDAGNKATIAQIVREHNAHDKMVEVLQTIDAWLILVEHHKTDTIQAEVQAALAAAKGA
jgi:hypothetical protein